MHCPEMMLTDLRLTGNTRERYCTFSDIKPLDAKINRHIEPYMAAVWELCGISQVRHVGVNSANNL